jgi:hypothetical protein
MRALHTVQWAIKNDIHIRSQVALIPLKASSVPRSHIKHISSLSRWAHWTPACYWRLLSSLTAVCVDAAPSER